jgi:hypothetical protein
MWLDNNHRITESKEQKRYHVTNSYLPVSTASDVQAYAGTKLRSVVIFSSRDNDEFSAKGVAMRDTLLVSSRVARYEKSERTPLCVTAEVSIYT